MIQTRFNTKIHIVRSDNGREYFNKDLEKGVLHQSRCARTHQQNGVAECKKQTSSWGSRD